MRKILLIVVFVELFVRCADVDSAIEYDDRLNFAIEDTLSVRTLNDTFFFSFPTQIEVVDSLLVVLDAYQKDTCFHVFDRYSGAHLQSFGLKGKGPGELLQPTGFILGEGGKWLYTYDDNQGKIVGYDLSRLVERPLPFREVRVGRIKDPGKFSMINNLCGYSLADGSFILQGNDDCMRFGKMRDGWVESIYADYPSDTEVDDPEELWAVWNYASRARMSPDGKRMAQATYIGGLLEMWDVENDTFIPRALRAIYPPRYRIVSGSVPAWIAWDDGTTIGFEDIAVSDSLIYGLLNGSVGDHYIYPRQISVFDWDGSSVARYFVDAPMSALAVDTGEEYIYALTHEAVPRLIVSEIGSK